MGGFSKKRVILAVILGFIGWKLGKGIYWRWTKVPSAVGDLVTKISFGEGAGDLRFFVLGDAGTGAQAQYEVAAAMEEHCSELKKQGQKLDGILLLGDNFYNRGVSSLEDPQWESKIWEPYGGPCLRELTIYAILGNHDYRQSAQAQVDMSREVKRWHMPHRFYSVAFGTLLELVAFDSNFADLCLSPQTCAVDFLRQRLGDSQNRWKVVIAHHPLTSSSDHGFNYQGGLLGFFLRPYVCSHVQAWISGHSHHMEHRKLPECDSDFYIVGSGGGDLYQGDKYLTQESSFFLSQFGYAQLHVTSDRLVMSYFDRESHLLYTSEQDPSVVK